MGSFFCCWLKKVLEFRILKINESMMDKNDGTSRIIIGAPHKLVGVGVAVLQNGVAGGEHE